MLIVLVVAMSEKVSHRLWEHGWWNITAKELGQLWDRCNPGSAYRYYHIRAVRQRLTRLTAADQTGGVPLFPNQKQS